MGQSRTVPRVVRGDASSLQRVVASSKTICAWRRALSWLEWDNNGYLVSPSIGVHVCLGACMLGGHHFEGPQAYWLLTRALCFSTLQSCSTGLGWPILLAEALVGIWSACMPCKVARWDLVGLDGSLRAMCLLWAPHSWVPVNSLIIK